MQGDPLMRKSRFTEAQIVGEYDAGASVAELARRHRIHANTIRLWKSKYNGMDVPDVVRLKELEAENAQMHRIIARLTLKVDAMDDLIRKNGWGPRNAKKQCGHYSRAGSASVKLVRSCELAGARQRSVHQFDRSKTHH
jgi:putative transposase